jgi:hypothetical protein
MFVLSNAGSQERRIRGLAWLLDWLADQAGETWQQRWMASGLTPGAATGGRRRSPGSKSAAGNRDGCALSCQERWSWRSAGTSCVLR